MKRPNRVFVVDDEKLAREGISLALGKDYRVEAFSSAEAAIESMLGNPPGMVLLDVGLPGMDGIQALEKIKQMYPYLPVIMITALEDVNTVAAAMKLGAHDYIVKPLQIDALLKTMRNAIDAISKSIHA